MQKAYVKSFHRKISPVPLLPLARPSASPNQAVFQTRTAPLVWNKYNFDSAKLFALTDSSTRVFRVHLWHTALSQAVISITTQDVRRTEQNCSAVSGKAELKVQPLQKLRTAQGTITTKLNSCKSIYFLRYHPHQIQVTSLAGEAVQLQGQLTGLRSTSLAAWHWVNN